MEEISVYLREWMSHFRLCTPQALQGLGAVDAHIRRRIRAIMVRQKKRQRFLYRHLVSRGVKAKTAAACAYCHKGAWVKSNQAAMTRAYPPFWFKRRMASLTALWRGNHHTREPAQLTLEF